jgi:hypothetical protein
MDGSPEKIKRKKWQRVKKMEVVFRTKFLQLKVLEKKASGRFFAILTHAFQSTEPLRLL